MTAKPKCFIIMPLTTPESYLKQYSGDGEHFSHILNSLFIPSAEKAGFEAIPPIAEGSENIHASIIRHLESEELVLCDMSILNVNVFFELGIRTALNKATCMVRDNYIENIPFDNSPINCHKYNGNVNYWNINSEIEKLAAHLIKSKNQIGDGNSLWKYFGMRLTAILEESKNPTEEMMKYLVDRIDSLKHSDNEENKKIDKTEQFTITVIDDKMSRQKLIELVTSECNLMFIKFDGIHSQDDRIIFKINNDCDAFWLNKCYAALCESLKGCQVLLNT